MRCGGPDKVGPEKLDDTSPCVARTRRQGLCVDAVQFEISVMWEEDDPTVLHGALKGELIGLHPVVEISNPDLVEGCQHSSP